MKLKDGRITFLVNRDYTIIEIEDAEAGITFCTIELTPLQLSDMMSRVCHVKVDSMEVYNLELIGHKQEYKEFIVELPKNSTYNNRKEIAEKLVKEQCPKGWKPRIYFNAQDSFFTKDGRNYARTIIDRWV